MLGRRLIALVTALTLTNGYFVFSADEDAGADNEPPGFSNELLLDDLRQPTAIDFLPDGRMLVTEREGRIIISHPDDPSLSGSVYLSIPNVATDGERGLLAIAVDPEFATNPYIYVYYANSNTGKLRVSRFTHSGAAADAASEVVIYQDPFVFSGCCHTGGVLLFGPDGKLWLGVGDKSQASFAQDPTKTHGKLLRFNKDGTIPADNPHAGNTSGYLEAIWSVGFRNPWKGSLDPLTGRLYVGEVGEVTWEDVHVIDPSNGGGENFGWPNCEGPCPGPTYDSPLYSYRHGWPWTPLGGSITGGPIYRGNAYPAEWYGRYFFGDYVNNRMRYLTFNPDGTVFDPNSSVEGDEAFHFAHSVDAIVDLKEGPDGMLYRVSIVRHGDPDPAASGFVMRIRFDDGTQAPVITQATANPINGDSPLLVTFSGAATDADSPQSELTYTWLFGDGNQGAGAEATHTYTAVGVYSARLQVSDLTHTSLSDPITIQVGASPVAEIAMPLDGLVFRAGDVIDFSAVTAGNDPSDTHTWTVLFGHDDHVHPALGPLQATDGQFTVPDDEHSFFGETNFQFNLRVDDADGLSATDQVTIWPDKVDLDFTTSPPGLQVTVDSVSLAGPIYDSLIGFNHVIGAPSGQCLAGVEYDFSSWSDGGTQNHAIVVPAADTAYTAAFSTTGATCASSVDPIDRTGWAVTADSQETVGENGSAVNAIDGDDQTFWHTEWLNSAPGHPHWIAVDMGAIHNVAGLRYQPRISGGAPGNGRIGDFRVEVSLNGADWVQVAAGSFPDTGTEQEVQFTPQDARHLRLWADSEAGDRGAWSSVAELNVLEATSGSHGGLPTAAIDQPSGNLTISAGEVVSFAGTGRDHHGGTEVSYLWQFGAGSGITDATIEDPGPVTFATPGTFNVEFTVTDSAHGPNSASDSVVVTVDPAGSGGVIDRSGWRVESVDSQELVGENGAAVNVLDGDPNTHWHTEWLTSNPGHPHEVVIDLGGRFSVNGVGYLPRQAGVSQNGRVSGYAIFISEDPANRGSAVASGVFPNNGAGQLVEFAAKEGRFLHFVATSEVNGNPWTSVAELNAYGSPAEGPGAEVMELAADQTSVHSFDSEETVGENGAAVNVLDGTPLTFWHTEWAAANPPHPHEIVLDLGESRDVRGFRLWNRTTSANGRIEQFDFYVSNTPGTWGLATASGSLANVIAMQEVAATPVVGRYVRLVARSEVNGGPWTSIGELRVLVSSGAGTPAPNGSIDGLSGSLTIPVGGTVTFVGTVTGDGPFTFHWDFGAGSGIADSTVEDPGPQSFNTAGTFVVTFTVTDTHGVPDPTPATLSVTVSPGTPTEIPRSSWRVHFVDSEETIGENGAAVNAIGQGSGDFWHTEWLNSSPGHDHELAVDLNDIHTVSGFRYQPRISGGVPENGRIAGYEFYVGNTGSDWTLVAQGTFPNSGALQEVSFTPTSARYVRLVAKSEVNGNPWTAVEDLQVLEIR